VTERALKGGSDTVVGSFSAVFVIPSEVEESLTISVARDYNFWVYIITNEHDSVLYVGMTNDLARRITEHRTGEISGFAADFRCKKLDKGAGCDCAREANQNLVARQKSKADGYVESTLD